MKNKLSSYFELTKPRITLLVLITTYLGFYLGGEGFLFEVKLIFLMLGTWCVCAGSSTLNHYLEREFDSKMMRTKNRPIPKGDILPAHALQFGMVLLLIGIVILYIYCNILTSFLSLLTAFLYVLVYTPMKRVSWLNTTVGAIPGAIPPLGGWAAATGTLNFDAGILFLILFLWQHPHFYAIAWMSKEDYNRCGFKMLPCLEAEGSRTKQQIYWYSLLLIPVSLIPTLTGLSGWVYFIGALIMGLMLFYIANIFNKSMNHLNAVKLLKATVYYLPALLMLIVFDTTF